MKLPENVTIVLVIIIFISLSLNTVQANIINKDNIFLKSRVISIENSINDNLKDEIVNLNSKKHYIVSFEAMDIDKSLLSSNGITLLSFIPNNAWFVSISNGDIVNKIELLGIKSIHSILLEDKISEYIRYDRIGDWAYTDDGDMIVLVKFFKDVDLINAKKITEKYATDFFYDLETINTIALAIPKQKINLLAAEDSVQWIDQHPPPDGDFLHQSTLKIGVDTIQSSPYQLDGSDINVLLFENTIPFEHDDLDGRIIDPEWFDFTSEHATLVAGIIAGDGSKNNSLKGIAPNATIIAYEHRWIFLFEQSYNNSVDIESNYNDAIDYYGVSLASNSWGINFNEVQNNCSLLGDYTSVSELLDNIVRGSLGNKISIFWANGNYGENYANSDLYHNTVPKASSKNVISVGATGNPEIDTLCDKSSKQHNVN